LMCCKSKLPGPNNAHLSALYHHNHGPRRSQQIDRTSSEGALQGIDSGLSLLRPCDFFATVHPGKEDRWILQAQ
jgi:hypothetical protein